MKPMEKCGGIWPSISFSRLFVAFEVVCPVANLNGWTLVIDPGGGHQVTQSGHLLSSTLSHWLPAPGYLWPRLFVTFAKPLIVMQYIWNISELLFLTVFLRRVTYDRGCLLLSRSRRRFANLIEASTVAWTNGRHCGRINKQLATVVDCIAIITIIIIIIRDLRLLCFPGTTNKACNRSI